MSLILLDEPLRRSLRGVIELQGRTFEGIHHVDGWVPQRLVTATGPTPTG